MKTEQSVSILAMSCISLLCAACGTSEDLSIPAARKGHLPIGAERASSSPIPIQKPHCVASAIAVGQQSPDSVAEGLAEPAPATCFDTFAEAVSFATGGQVQLQADARSQDIRPDQLVTTVPPFLIGVDFMNRDFNGPSLLTKSETDCTTSPQQLTRLQWFWNDVISSAIALGGCNHSFHFEDIDFGGEVVDCQTNCEYIGDALNNRTSSIGWSP